MGICFRVVVALTWICSGLQASPQIPSYDDNPTPPPRVVTIRKVAVRGDPTPGKVYVNCPPGVNSFGKFLQFGSPVLSKSSGVSVVAFQAYFNCPANVNLQGEGLFSEATTSGGLSLLLETGTAVGGGLVSDVQQSDARIRGSTTAVRVNLDFPGMAGVPGLVRHIPGAGLTLLSDGRQPMPGGDPETIFQYQAHWALTGASQVGFWAQDILGGRGAYLTNGGSGLELIETNDQVVLGGQVSSYSHPECSATAAGSVAMLAQLSGATDNWAVLHVDSTGLISVIAKSSDNNPLNPGTALAIEEGPTALNLGGSVAFRAGNPQGIFIGEPGGVFSGIVANGMAAPGRNGVTGSSVFTALGPPTINSSGEVAFEALISGGAPNDSGLWSNASGVLREVLLTGDSVSAASNAAVGASAVVVDGFDLNGSVTEVVLNNRGWTAFTATVNGGNTGLFVGTPDGQVHLIVATGLPFTVNGVTKDVAALQFRAGAIEESDTGLVRSSPASNQYADVAFSLIFSGGIDGGVFVARVE